jgi:hypothetical protein
MLMRAMTLRNAVRAMAPFLYALGLFPVLVGTMSVVTFAERRLGFWNDSPGIQLADLTTLRYNGDLLVVMTIFLLGGIVFGVLASVILRLERLHGPAIGDHLRHCTALYVILATLVVLLLATYENQAAHGVSLGYGVAVVALFAIGYAILIDALALWQQRQRYVRASLGNIA